MTRRYVLWAIGVLLILAGAGLGWRAWVESTTTSLPPVAVPKPEVPDLDAPMEHFVTRMGPHQADTLADIARNANVILVVRLGTDLTEYVDLGTPPGTMRHTIYTFHILDTIKGPFRVGERVRVARMGGRRSFEHDFPRPGAGESFVVFLMWWPRAGAYQHLFGPSTTFRVVNGTIQPVGRYFNVQPGQDAKNFVRELRRMVQQR